MAIQISACRFRSHCFSLSPHIIAFAEAVYIHSLRRRRDFAHVQLRLISIELRRRFAAAAITLRHAVHEQFHARHFQLCLPDAFIID